MSGLFPFSALDASLSRLRPASVNPLTFSGMPGPNLPASIKPLQPDFGVLATPSYMDEYTPKHLQQTHLAYDREGMPISDGPQNGPFAETHYLVPYYNPIANRSLPSVLPVPKRYEVVMLEKSDRAMSQRWLKTSLISHAANPTELMYDYSTDLRMIPYDQNLSSSAPGVPLNGGSLCSTNAIIAWRMCNLFERRSTTKKEFDIYRNYFTEGSLLREVAERYYFFGVNFSNRATSNDHGDSKLMAMFPGLQGIDSAPYDRVLTSFVKGEMEMWNYALNLHVRPGSHLWLGLRYCNMDEDTNEFSLLSSETDGGGDPSDLKRFYMDLPQRSKSTPGGVPRSASVSVPMPQFFITGTPNGTIPRRYLEYTYKMPRMAGVGDTEIEYDVIRSHDVIWWPLGVVAFDRRKTKGMVPVASRAQGGADPCAEPRLEDIPAPHMMSQVMGYGKIKFIFERALPE